MTRKTLKSSANGQRTARTMLEKRVQLYPMNPGSSKAPSPGPCPTTASWILPCPSRVVSVNAFSLSTPLLLPLECGCPPLCLNNGLLRTEVFLLCDSSSLSCFQFPQFAECFYWSHLVLFKWSCHCLMLAWYSYFSVQLVG